MNTDKIKIFLDLAETLNFSRTALNMNITQSAVSQSISSLEKYLGTKLFYRNRKKVSLTPAGRLFYSGMHPVLTQFGKAVIHAREVAQSVKTMLTIGFSGTPYDVYALAELIKDFREDYPQVKVFLENYDYRTLVERLKQGYCDVILTKSEAFSESGEGGFDYQLLAKSRYCVAVSKDYDFKGQQPVSFQDLANERLIFLDPRWCLPVKNALQTKLTREFPEVDYTLANNIVDFSEMIRAGLGAGVASPLAVDPRDQDVRLLPLAQEYTTELGIASLEGHKSEAATNFINWLVKHDLPAMHPIEQD